MVRKRKNIISGKAPDPETEIPVYDEDWVFEPTARTNPARNTSRGQEEEIGDTSLGELLTTARNDLGWSRATLSQKTKIGQNSIVRYEKAGTDDEDGQYPPSNKLAILCWHLKMNPLQVMAACLPLRFRQEGYLVFKDPQGEPLYDFMKAQYQEVLHENHIYRTLFSRIFGEKPNPESQEHSQLLWLIGAGKELYAKQAKFDQEMIKDHQFAPIARHIRGPEMPEEFEEAWTYKSSPEINLINGAEIAEILGWEQPHYASTYPSSKNSDALRKVISTNEKIRRQNMSAADNKKSPEEDLPSPPSSNPKPTQIAKKESDDGQPSN